MENKIIKSGKIFKTAYFLLISMFLLVPVMVYFYAQNREEKNVEQEENIGALDNENKKYQPEILVENINQNLVRVTNTEEKFSLEIAEDWKIQRSVNDKLKLKAYKEGSQTNPESMDFTDGSMIWVYVYNNDRKNNLNEWLEEQNISGTGYDSIKFQKYDALVKKEKAQGELDSNLNYMYIENSLIETYLVSVNNRIYKMSCVSLGEEYNAYANECRNILVNINL